MALYYLSLACLFTHELDAVTHAEWRLFFLFQDMPDSSASMAFVAIHVPLFFLVLWLSHHQGEVIRERSRLGFASFVVLHGILHFSFSSHADYDFHGVLSRALILSSAAFAALYLARHWQGAHR